MNDLHKTSSETRYYDDHHIRPLAVPHAQARVPSALEEYLFDLNGFLILRSVLSADDVSEGNARLEAIPSSLPRGGWYGWVQRENHPEHRGASYQQVFELGGVFERMIDHPTYLNYVLRFLGGQGTYDHLHGPAFIDEAFVTVRGPGKSIPLHSGGHEGCKRTSFNYHNGRFQCAQVNVLIAFTDVGPGDGATMIIPGSHKSNIIHPAFLDSDPVQNWSEKGGASADAVPGAIEVHMQAGDAIVFVDATCHGSAKRVNPGTRRHTVYRYSSAWNRTRFGYHASPELLSRLNPVARKMVHPQEYVRPPGTEPRW